MPQVILSLIIIVILQFPILSITITFISVTDNIEVITITMTSRLENVIRMT